MPQAGWGRTPEWATTVRDPSARSRARRIERSSPVLFQLGSTWPATSRATVRGDRAAPGVAFDRQWFVVPAPQGHRRMVAEEGDGLAGLGHGLAAHLPVSPLERQVLPDQHALPIGRFVELGPGDVGVHPEQIQAGLPGQGDVAGQLLAGGLGQGPAGGPGVDALEEEALAVDGGHEVPDSDLAQSGANAPVVADLGGAGGRRRRVRWSGRWAVGGGGGGRSGWSAVVGLVGVPAEQHADVDLVEGLAAEGVRPPQLRPLDGQPPADLVDPRRQGVLLLMLGGRSPARPRAGPWCASGRHAVRSVSRSASSSRVAASSVASRHKHLERTNAHRAGLVDAHRSPDPARVPVGIDAVPVLEDARQVAFGGEVRRAGAGHFDRQQVVRCGPTARRSPRRCGERNTPRCRPGTRRPARRRPGRKCRRRSETSAGPAWRRCRRKPPAVEDRPVGVGERRVGAPVARERVTVAWRRRSPELRPGRVSRSGRTPAEVLVRRRGQPLATQVHPGAG